MDGIIIGCNLVDGNDRNLEAYNIPIYMYPGMNYILRAIYKDDPSTNANKHYTNN